MIFAVMFWNGIQLHMKISLLRRENSTSMHTLLWFDKVIIEEGFSWSAQVFYLFRDFEAKCSLDHKSYYASAISVVNTIFSWRSSRIFCGTVTSRIIKESHRKELAQAPFDSKVAKRFWDAIIIGGIRSLLQNPIGKQSEIDRQLRIMQT